MRFKRPGIKLLFSLLFTWALLEGVSLYLWPKTVGSDRLSPAQRNEVRMQRADELRQKLNPGSGGGLSMLHPYLGYVGNPGMRPLGPANPAYNEYGMVAEAGLFQNIQAGTNSNFVIAVLGGSAAEMFSALAGDYLADLLAKKHPFFESRRPVIICLAAGGYKQPQQLIHLLLMRLYGFEFDLVLNMDGFNDVVLAAENEAFGINPLFPSGSHMGFLGNSVDSLSPASLELIASIYDEYKWQLKLNQWIAKRPFRYSPFCNVLYFAVTRRSESRIEETQFLLSESLQNRDSRSLKGPPYPDHEVIYAEAAALWSRASEMIHVFCNHFDMDYIHVLQPNQYVEGSKQMTDTEKEIAYRPDDRWSQRARIGYPYLMEAGKKLADSGIAFSDFTGIFSNVSEDVYIDTCCHYNIHGNEIIANALAEIIAEMIESRDVEE